MFPWTKAPLSARGADRDAGFTLLEVVVALGVLMLVAAALLPQLVVGIRSTGTASKATALKSVAQAELDRLRNLPYRVAPQAGNYIDLLDRYYPNRAAPSAAPTCSTGGGYAMPANESSWKGFVTASSTGKCDFEPASGDFYRTVDLQTHDALGEVAVVTDVQFLSSGMESVPMSPSTAYDSTQVGRDLPPSTQIGATVTVLYDDRNATRAYSTYTQIAQRPTSVNRLRSTASVTTVNVASTTATGASITLAAGVLNLKGALSNTSTASADVAATVGGLSTGSVDTSKSAYGASDTEVAPPTSSITASPQNPRGLNTDGSCSLVCWGGTQLGPSPAGITADAARPRVGTWGMPVQSHLSDLGNAGLKFDTGDTAGYRSGLGLTGPLVRLSNSATGFASGISGCRPAAAGVTSYLSAFGVLDATAEAATGQRVDACGVAKAARVSLLPTSFAPDGVVRVTLENAYAHCQVIDGVPSSDYGYSALVEISDGDGGYRPAIPITGTAPSSLLPPEQYTLGDHGTLDRYIDSWSALKAPEVSASGKQVSVALPGVFTAVTTPVRTTTTTDPETDEPTVVPDDSSPVIMTLGALSCHAMDAR